MASCFEIQPSLSQLVQLRIGNEQFDPINRRFTWQAAFWVKKQLNHDDSADSPEFSDFVQFQKKLSKFYYKKNDGSRNNFGGGSIWEQKSNWSL